MNVNDQCFNDKEIMEDALESQKYLTDDYNVYANECATPTVKSDFMKILNEEHQLRSEIFTEMQTRGWYTLAPAEQPKIDQAKQKFPG